MSKEDYSRIWAKSKQLSKPYWDLYEQLMTKNEQNDSFNYVQHDIHLDGLDLSSNSGESIEAEDEHKEIDPGYLEFIEITRKHRLERDRQKKIAQSKKSPAILEEYFKDLSQVNTLVEDNLARVPGRKDPIDNNECQNLVSFYGSQEAYDKITTMEMFIDENFTKMCLKHSPSYWPAIPINTRPYLKNE